MIEELELPECHWGTIKGIYPFFLPLCVPDGRGGTRYLTEDYAFSHRLAQIGITPMADTTIKLFHYKKYGFSYDDLQPRTRGRELHGRDQIPRRGRPAVAAARERPISISLHAGREGVIAADGRRQTVVAWRTACLRESLPRPVGSTLLEPDMGHTREVGERFVLGDMIEFEQSWLKGRHFVRLTGYVARRSTQSTASAANAAPKNEDRVMNLKRPITASITIGDQPTESDLSQLRQEGFTGVVNLRNDGEPEQPLNTGEEGNRVRAVGMEYLHYGVGAAR